MYTKFLISIFDLCLFFCRVFFTKSGCRSLDNALFCDVMPHLSCLQQKNNTSRVDPAGKKKRKKSWQATAFRSVSPFDAWWSEREGAGTS